MARCIRVQKQTIKRPTEREIDTRSPSGKPLPY
jgi:hypothetical protein